jgi:hypothetical protein
MNTGRRFEDVVAKLIEGYLKVFSGANVRVFRRKRYPGAKDPMGYEIDISLEMTLDPGLALLIIFECKDYGTPAKRSIVQNLIQVRDDISAHKAILITRNGFDSGAVRLAENSRIALWQVVRRKLVTVSECAEDESIHRSAWDIAVPALMALSEYLANYQIHLNLDQLQKDMFSSTDGIAIENVGFKAIFSESLELDVDPPPCHAGITAFITPYPMVPTKQLADFVSEAILRFGGVYERSLRSRLTEHGQSRFADELISAQGLETQIQEALKALEKQILDPNWKLEL